MTSGRSISALSATDKDRVILGLWTDLRDERAKSRALEQRLAEVGGSTLAADGAKGTLLEELRRRGTRKGNGAEAGEPGSAWDGGSACSDPGSRSALSLSWWRSSLWTSASAGISSGNWSRSAKRISGCNKPLSPTSSSIW